MDNAVAVMRVSSGRQNISGDSIEHQKDQIDLYCKTRNIYIKKYFVFVESASKEQQPIQEAINYCKDPKNQIQTFIIKSIDRFTRGGSSLYDNMKSQLIKHNIKLIDIYGVVNNQYVNTLEHLGVKYSWSVYNPSKKAELLEAERGQDEIRDIMTRMMGAEIRYTRLGFRTRGAPLGYVNKRKETLHGNRFVLAPHPRESKWIKKMYELKVQGQLSDQEIVDHINLMGYKSRKHYRRHPHNKNKIIGFTGQNKLTVKTMDRILAHPLYVGITIERWTDLKPVKLQSKGLVSIETFNKANAGKIMIIEEDGMLDVVKGKQLRKRLVNTAISLRYPYKRLVFCAKCGKEYYGSASRGRLGTYYPAYHCNKRGHYHRVPLKKFHEEIVNFLSLVRIKSKFIEEVQNSFDEDKRHISQYQMEEFVNTGHRLEEIEAETRLIIDKIKSVTSPIVIAEFEKELETLQQEKEYLSKSSKKPQETQATEKRLYKSNKLPISLIKDHNPTRKARLFDMLFAQIPTYDGILERNVVLNPQFRLADH